MINNCKIYWFSLIILINISGCVIQGNNGLCGQSVDHLVIYHEDKKASLALDYNKKENSNILGFLVSVTNNIEITNEQNIQLNNFRKETSKRGYAIPAIGGFYFYIFFDKKGDILFNYSTSKLWPNWIVVENVAFDKKGRIKILYGDIKIFKNKKLYDFLIKILNANVKNQNYYGIKPIDFDATGKPLLDDVPVKPPPPHENDSEKR